MELFRSSNLLSVISIVALGVILVVGAKRTDRANAYPSQLLTIPIGVVSKADELLSTAKHRKLSLPEEPESLPAFGINERRRVLEAQLETWRSDRNVMERELTTAKSIVESSRAELNRLKAELDAIVINTDESEDERVALLNEVDNAWSDYLSALGRSDADEKYEKWHRLKYKKLKEFDKKVKKTERSAVDRRSKLSTRICTTEQLIAAKQREIDERSNNLALAVKDEKSIMQEFERLNEEEQRSTQSRNKKLAKVANDELSSPVELAQVTQADLGFGQFYRGESSKIHDNVKSLVGSWMDDAAHLMGIGTQTL